MNHGTIEKFYSKPNPLFTPNPHRAYNRTMKPIRPHPNPKDASQVEVLTGMGASPEYIAAHLHITPEELQQHYPKPLAHGLEEANLRVAQAFFEMATSKEYPQMTLAWMKMRARWTDAPPSTSTEEDNVEIEEVRQKLLKLINRAPNAG